MKRSSSSRRTRDRSSIASGSRARDRAGPGSLRSPSFFTPAVLSLSDSGSDLDDFQATVPDDRRLHIPTPPSRVRVRTRASMPAYSFSGTPSHVVAPGARKTSQSRGKAFPKAGPAALLFAAPKTVQVCVQRGQRREVLHALGKAGSKVKPGRYGPFSKVRCK